MSETYTPAGAVGTQLKRATVGEAATGTHGDEFMRQNVSAIADKIRFINDAGTLNDSGWIVPTLINSWTDSSAVAYRKGAADGRVQFRGVLASGSSGTVAFNLPAGYRPAANVNISAIRTSDGVAYSLQVDTAGDVTIGTAGTGLPSLSAVTFLIG